MKKNMMETSKKQIAPHLLNNVILYYVFFYVLLCNVVVVEGDCPSGYQPIYDIADGVTYCRTARSANYLHTSLVCFLYLLAILHILNRNDN